MNVQSIEKKLMEYIFKNCMLIVNENRFCKSYIDQYASKYMLWWNTDFSPVQQFQRKQRTGEGTIFSVE